MRRPILLIVLALSLVAFAATLITGMRREKGLPAFCHAKLDDYVHYRCSSWPAKVTVRSVARASKPRNFSPAMSFATFGDSVHFQTDLGYTGPRPLPFPPKDVWCVLLQCDQDPLEVPSDENVPVGLFVALHLDMYTADWVVHEITGGACAQEFMRQASLLGCDLGVRDQIQASVDY